MSITTRWAVPGDQGLTFVHEHVPQAAVLSRISERRIAIAEQDGRPVAALQLEYLWASRPYIALIRVLPEFQRQGAGRALLDFVEAALREEGHSHLYSSSQADEAAPQAWHRHMGFAECGFLAGINPGGIGEVFFVKNFAAATDAKGESRRSAF